MDKRIILAREDLKKTNYWMITLMISALTLIILSLTNVLTINSNNEHYIDFVHGYQTGLSFALFVFPCINLISNFFLAKNEVKLIEKYIKTVNLYKEHYQGKALNQKVKQVINQKTKVNLNTSLDSSKLNQVNIYFNFLNYALLAGGVYCMTMILASLNQEGVRKRTIMSSFSYRKYNWIVFASLGLASFIVWLAYMIISFILFKEIMLSGNGIAYILNSFVFSICSLAVGFLIGTITHNKQAIGGIVNVVALGTSFLCGCFVPMSFMPSYVLKIAHILPTYYFVQNNELIKTLEYFKLETLQPIIINGIIVLGFTLSFILITLMISKRKQKIG